MKYEINKSSKGPLYVTEEDLIKENSNCPASEKTGGDHPCVGSLGKGKDTEAKTDKTDKISIPDNSSSNKILSSEPEVGYSKRLGIIDKNNIVQATPGAEKLARLFMNGEKEGSLSSLREQFEEVGNHTEPFDGKVYKDKSTGDHFLIHAEPSNKFGQRIHYVSKLKK